MKKKKLSKLKKKKIEILVSTTRFQNQILRAFAAWKQP
jgi:hypothetical protein